MRKYGFCRSKEKEVLSKILWLVNKRTNSGLTKLKSQKALIECTQNATTKKHVLMY